LRWGRDKAIENENHHLAARSADEFSGFQNIGQVPQWKNSLV
jgi:hypothetical protein